MATPSLARGRVVFATRPDQNGVNAKHRPWVLLASEADVPPGEPIPAVAISHTFPKPLPPDHVLLPFSNDRRRPAMTGLYLPSAAVCSWLDVIHPDELRSEQDVVGVVPGALLENIRLLALRLGSAGDEPS